MKKESTVQDISTTTLESDAAAAAPVVKAVGNQPALAADAPGADALSQLLAENERLKATIRLNAAHRQITGELARAGARSPELLFEAVRGELKFTAEGELKNGKALIDSITGKFPEQFGSELPASIDAGAGTTGRNQLTREVLAKMKPTDIAQLDWAEVRRVLAGG